MAQFRIDQFIRPHLRGIETYEAIDPSTILAKKAGIPLHQVLKLDGNENPYGCSKKVLEAVASLGSFHMYPDPQQREIRRSLSEYTGVDPSYIIAGSGCDEIIDLLLKLFLEPGDNVLECEPTFGMYAFSTRVCGGEIISAPTNETFNIDVEAVRNAINDRTKIVFIASPNNPTGNAIDEEALESILSAGIVVAVDETYYEFSKSTSAHMVPDYENLIVLRSLSKWAGLAGLRIGYGIMSPTLVKHIIDIKPPYNVNVAAEAALLASLEDAPSLLERVDSIVKERERFFAELEEMDSVVPYPSRANFILCQFAPNEGYRVYKDLATRGIFVRYFSSPRLKDCVRISIGTEDQMNRVLAALNEVV